MAYMHDKDLSKEVDAYQNSKALEPEEGREKDPLAHFFDMLRAQKKD